MQTTRITYRSELDGVEDYYLLMQDEQRSPAQGGDVLVFLHGHGGLPEQLLQNGRYPSRLLGFPAAATAAGWTILAPHLRGDAWMNRQAEADLAQLTAAWRRQFQPRRFVLSGGSMGGTGVLIWAGLHPTEYDAHLAYCGAADMVEYHAFCRQNQAARPIMRELADTIEQRYGGPPEQVPEEYALRSAVNRAKVLARPMFFIHGRLDAVIPVALVRKLARLTVGNSRVRYVEVPEGDHDSIISPAGFLSDLTWVAGPDW